VYSSTVSSFRLCIQIYGPLIIRWSDGRDLRLPSAKQRAMLALLAISPGYARTRSWLQAQLWSDFDDHQGRANLRQNLFQLRRALGERFADTICSEGDILSLVEGAFELTGSAQSGEFLEGIDIAEEGFEDWLRDMRAGSALPVVNAPAPKPEKPAPPVRLRPKLAVLPFLEFPATEAEGALGDAVAQELTRVLSRSQMIDVVAHLSSRAFKPPALDLGVICEKLVADYLVTGCCRRSGETLVLDLDFQETASGSLIWSERFKLSFMDFLAGDSGLFQEIAQRIVGSLLSTSVELGVTRPLPSVSSHALLMSAIVLMNHMAESNFTRALTQLDAVAERAPRHSLPRAWKAQWYILRVFQGLSDDPRRDRQRADDEASAALDLNPECAFSLAIDGNVKATLDRDFDAAEHSFDASLRLNPSSPLACQLKCVLFTFRGKGAEAVALAERAQILSPCDPRGPFFDALSAGAYVVDRQYEKAVEFAERSLRANPRHVSAHRIKIVGLVRLGRMQEAADAAKELLRRDPKMTVTGYLATHPAGRAPHGQSFAEALGEAGIPKR
jgi:TolB-like protein